MKDFVTSWNKLLGRTYASVKTNSEDCRANLPRNVALDALHGQFRNVLTLAFFGLLAFGSATFILLARPYDLIFELKCVFEEGGEMFELWRRPPVDLYLRVFLYNVTNKDAFLEGREKLRVQEVGPYVYRELMTHEDVVFNDNGTLTTTPSHPLVWVPELSEDRSEDDQLILPHIALLSIAQVVSKSSFLTRLGLNAVIRQTDSQPLVQMSAKEFMFGYESALMTLGSTFLPTWIDFDKLGLIERMYNFEGDFETVFTGSDNLNRTGLIDKYRGDTRLPQWPGECGNVHGASDGTKFASHVDANDTLLFYRRSMCRAHKLVRVNATRAAGFDAYVYGFEPNANDNGRRRPENACFCKEGGCLPAGLLDVHGCYYGFPIATSYPHFLEADPVVRESVDGSEPNPEKHRSYFVVEPISGLPLEVAARFQINMVLGDLDAMAHVDRFSNMVLPLLWTESRLYNLPDALQTRFQLYLNVLPVVERVAMYGSYALGVFLVGLAAYKYAQKMGAKQRRHFKRSLSYNTTRRESLTTKELQTYLSSLVVSTHPDETQPLKH